MLLAVHYRVMEQLGSLESTQEARVALGYRLRQLLRFFRALQTSRMLLLSNRLQVSMGYLTIRPVARKGYESIAHEAKPNGLLTSGP